MNKIDTRTISFYIIQILELAATSEIRKIVVCGFMLLNDGYQKEAHILPYIISENSHPVRTLLFGIYFLFFFLLSFFLSFFHSFFVQFFSFFLSVFPKHIVFLHSLLQGT